MDSASVEFVVFGLLVAVVLNFSRSTAWRSLALFAASLGFLAALVQGDGVVLLPLAGFLLLGYAALVALRRKWVLSVKWLIVAIVFIYIWMKKYTFLPEVIFMRCPYFTLGLSYIFFRVLHVVIEAGDNGDESRISIGAYLLYTLNFTTFVSGPIQRYEAFARDQFADPPIELSARIVGLQLERIVRGFFKVNVLAALLDMMRSDALAQISQPLQPPLRFYAAFRLAVVYPFFLYANFSGYIDIVIALARLTRVRLPENFNRPFSASSFIDFWNRWHITLSTWLKVYVYNPLLVELMRRIRVIALEPLLGVFSFFVTFFLVGLWHGRTSEFIVFGILQGGGVSINKIWQLGLTRIVGRRKYRQLATSPVYVAFGRGLTFCWFAFSLFWFWARWNQIDTVFSALGVVRWIGVWAAVWLCATAVLASWEQLRSALLAIQTRDEPVLTCRYARVVYASAMGLAAFVMIFLLSQPAPEIVYKAF